MCMAAGVAAASLRCGDADICRETELVGDKVRGRVTRRRRKSISAVDSGRRGYTGTPGPRLPLGQASEPQGHSAFVSVRQVPILRR